MVIPTIKVCSGVLSGGGGPYLMGEGAYFRNYGNILSEKRHKQVLVGISV